MASTWKMALQFRNVSTFTAELRRFSPWELAHTLIWRAHFFPAYMPLIVAIGFTLVWVVVGISHLSLGLGKQRVLAEQVISGRMYQTPSWFYSFSEGKHSFRDYRAPAI